MLYRNCSARWKECSLIALTIWLVGCGSGDSDVPPSVVNIAPTAVFTVSIVSGDAPLDVTFDASDSSDSDGTISSYNWDFGDGSTDMGSTTSHRFINEGDFIVVLTVTDNEGDTGTSNNTISVLPAPVILSHILKLLKND